MLLNWNKGYLRVCISFVFVGATVEDRRISRFSFLPHLMAETDHHSHERAETPLNSYRNEGKGIHSIDTRKTRGWSLIICLIVYNTCTKTGH